MPDDKNPKIVTKGASPMVSDLLPEIRSQFQFVKDYASSPKYKERLSKMVNAERNLQQPLSAQPFVNEVMSGSRTDAPTDVVVSDIMNNNGQRLNALSQGKISISDTDLGRNTAGGYDSSYKDVRLNEDLTRANPTVPAHEFSHAINNGQQPYSPAFDEKYLKKIFIPPTNSRFEGEVQKPTEVKARLDAIRYLGAKKGIFDAGKTDFTPQDFRKLMKDKEISNDYNFKQILDQLPKDRQEKGFVWLMNEIASNNQPSANEDLV